MPCNIGSDYHRLWKVHFWQFFNKVVLFHICLLREKSCVKKLISFELYFFLYSFSLLELYFLNCLWEIVCALPEEDHLTVQHFLWYVLEVVNNLEVSHPIFVITFALGINHLVPKFFNLDFSGLFELVHDFFNIRRHIVLVDSNNIRLPNKLSLFREVVNNGKSDVAAWRYRSLVFFAQIFHVIWCLVDGLQAFEVHLF